MNNLIYGWTGKHLRVDLSSSQIDVLENDVELMKNYLGARGLGIKIMMDEIDPRIDAFEPQKQSPDREILNKNYCNYKGFSYEITNENVSSTIITQLFRVFLHTETNGEKAIIKKHNIKKVLILNTKNFIGEIDFNKRAADIVYR